MFCGKCGAQNDEGVAFCKNCGAPLGAGQGSPAGSSSPAGSDPNHKKIGIVIVAAAAVLVLVLVFSSCGGRSYKSTVKQFLDATMDMNVKKMLKLMPDKYLEEMLDQFGFKKNELDDFIDEYGGELGGMLGAFDDEDLSIKFKIQGADDVSSKDLREIKETYEDYGVKVKAAKTVKVEMTIKYGGDDTKQTIEVPVIKVGRSWYIDMESLGEF